MSKRAELPKGMSARQFGELIEVTHATVGSLLERGMPEPSEDWQAALRWYVRYIDRGRSVDSEARASWERERARKLQIENDARSGTLIRLADVQAGNNEAAAIFARELQGLPGRVATELAGINDPALVRQRLSFEASRIRKAVTDRLCLLVGMAVRNRDNEAGADKDAGSVGRRKPRVAGRKRGAGAMAK